MAVFGLTAIFLASEAGIQCEPRSDGQELPAATPARLGEELPALEPPVSPLWPIFAKWAALQVAISKCGVMLCCS